MKKSVSILLFSTLTALLATSCGILGSKDPAKRSLSFQSTGCLDQFGSLVKQYIDTTVDIKEWDRAWSCVDDSIKLFDQFVKSENTTGYSKQEIQQLLSRFIFTQGVDDEFVSNVIQLKASFVGGSPDFVTKQELKLFRAFAGILRSRSVSLYPYLKARKENPTPSYLKGVLEQTELLAKEIKEFMAPYAHSEYTFDQAFRLVELLNQMQFKETPEATRKWFNLVREIKTTLVSGNPTGFSGQDLENLLSFIVSSGGAYLVITGDHSHTPDLQTEASQILARNLHRTWEYWDQKLPLTQLEQLIDQIPDSWLGDKAQELRDGAKTVIRPTFTKLFGALKNNTHIGPEFIDTLAKLYADGMKAEKVLNELFKDDEMITSQEISDYSRRLTSSPEAKRIADLASSQLGLFPAGAKEILFSGPMKDHTRTNLSTLQWYDLISQLVLDGYGNTADGSNKKGSVEDLKVIIETYRPLLLSIGMVHPLVQEVWKKRFREANLFTSSGNGDNYMDRREVTTYLTMLSSMSTLTSKITSDLFKPQGNQPALCAEKEREEYLKAPTYDVQCFRKEFFSRIDEYWKNFPDLLAEWRTYTPEQKDRFKSALEMAARREGVTEKNITEYDVASYAGVPHYVEAVLKKYDVTGPNGKPDGVLNREEVVNQVFPVFKNELSKITNINIGFVNKAILIYLMQKGHSPFKCDSKPKAGEIADLLWWLITGKNKKDFQANRLRVYEIFESLSLPATPDCPAKTSNDAGTQVKNPLEDVLDYFPKDE